MTTLALILTLAYIACAVFTYGMVNAHFQRRWPDVARDFITIDRGFAVAIAALTPLGLIGFLIASLIEKQRSWYGWKL